MTEVCYIYCSVDYVKGPIMFTRFIFLKACSDQHIEQAEHSCLVHIYFFLMPEGYYLVLMHSVESFSCFSDCCSPPNWRNFTEGKLIPHNEITP